MTDERIRQSTWDLPLRLVGSTSVWPSWPASIWVCSTELLLPFCLSLKRDEPKNLLSLPLLLSLCGKGAGVPFPRKAAHTGHYPEAHQVAHLQGPCRLRRTLLHSAGHTWEWSCSRFPDRPAGLSLCALACSVLFSFLTTVLPAVASLRSKKVADLGAASDYPAEKQQLISVGFRAFQLKL